MNLLEIANMTEDEARDYLEKLRWPNGPVCHNCEKQNVTRMQGKSHRKGLFQCNNPECRQQFTVKCKSVLESSKISLRKWAMAFHLLCSSKKGFSALQLQRELSLGSYRTAWFMLHRIRHAMASNSLDKPLAGVVEVDETWVGGKPRYIPGQAPGVQGKTDKQPVAALVEREGRVVCGPVERVTTEAMVGAIKDFVDASARLQTDESHVYYNMSARHQHDVVNHSRKEYARRNPDGFSANINTAESFFALIKRGHYGVYHSMSKIHLPLYCGEFGFRWNHRKVSDSERRDAAYMQAPGKRLKYKTPAKSA
jgi:transposase-like protein